MLDLTIIGNLVKDPEQRQTQTGKLVTTFTVAADEKDDVTYVRVTAWEKLAEIARKYLKKGDKCFVMGKPVANAYKDRQGEAKASLEVTARRIEFMMRPSKEFAKETKEPKDYVEVKDDDLPF